MVLSRANCPLQERASFILKYSIWGRSSKTAFHSSINGNHSWQLKTKPAKTNVGLWPLPLSSIAAWSGRIPPLHDPVQKLPLAGFLGAGESAFQCRSEHQNAASVDCVVGALEGLKAARLLRWTKVRKRVLLIAASILAARKLAQCEPGAWVPATISAIADSIRWAEQIMEEIDRRHPVKGSVVD